MKWFARSWKAWLAGGLVLAGGQELARAADTPDLPPLPVPPPPAALRTNLARPALVRPNLAARTNATPAVTAGSPDAGAVSGHRSLVPVPRLTPIPRSNFFPNPGLRSATMGRQEQVFAWDATVKEYNARPGETSIKFAFNLTNTSPQEVSVNYVRTSCGCTVAKLPSNPWVLAAGTNGTLEVVVDVRGKSGILTKTVTVDSSAGYRVLTVRVAIPSAPAGMTTLGERARNLQVAIADRQAVFRGDCARCHVDAGIGQHGQALFAGVCGVCHEAEHRASMVPNLRALNKPTDKEYWTAWITKGKADSLMPAFAESEGGPLKPDQIDSLVQYLTGAFAGEIKAAKPAAPAAPLLRPAAQAKPTPPRASGPPAALE
jgi:mono/diheme cytochrome c family protein